MENNLLFSDKFNSTTKNEITDIIARESFFSMERAIDPKIVDKILSEVDLFKLKLNSTEISSVHADDGYFSSNAMAKSNTLFKLLTSEKILEISTQYLGDKFRLKCHRIYSTNPITRGAWHTDNKQYGDKDKKIKGLVVIIYLNDVFDGELQAIRKSHLISDEYKYSNYDEDAINEFDKGDIASFKLPVGSIIIYDSRTIHRAKPYYSLLWRRKSLFFQIDNEIDDGEKVLINSSFVNNIDKRLFIYLGMGQKNNMPHEPNNNKIKNLNFKNILFLQGQLVIAILHRFLHLLRSMLTGTIKRKIKKILLIKRVPYNIKYKKKN